jgi:antitoxin component HigA of HigAB toxin-antitoxin module
MQACSPVALEVAAVFDGGSELEARLHSAHAEFRLHGEWFDVPLADVLAAAEDAPEDRPSPPPPNSALHRYLAENGISRADFAANAGVTLATVSRWISGHRLPPLDKAKEVFTLTDGAVGLTDWPERAAQSPDAPEGEAA